MNSPDTRHQTPDTRHQTPDTILAIDTSCDDTAAAVTRGNRVLSNVVWSQASLHAKWGGVVPSLAKRAHQDRLPWVVKKAVSGSRLTINDIHALAVTVGPGLAPALEAGIHYAKALALLHETALILVNHLEGHIMSSLASSSSKFKVQSSKLSNPPNLPNLPNSLALVVSGGHTQLVLTPYSLLPTPKYQPLADTLDDALGESLDKAARMLGLGYPGGAILEKFAREGNPQKYQLPLPLLGKENQGHFSFSGLKTAFYRLVEKVQSPQKTLTKHQICDLAACFQSTAFDHLIRVISRSIEKARPCVARPGLNTIHDLLVGGGVASNIELRKRLRKLGKQFNLKVSFPYSKKLCTDNAAMIGLAAQWALARGQVAKTKSEIAKIDRQPNLTLAKL